MLKQVSFTVFGEPKSKGRPRFARVGNHVRAFTPAQTAHYENLVKLSYLNQHRGTRLNGAIEAQIIGYFPIPKSTSKKKRAAMLDGKVHHTKPNDCDNIAKAILDALNNVAYDDDRQVCKLTVEKLYSAEPRVDITLIELEEDV